MEGNKRQGGWIVTFVAIGGLLVLGLIAGLYYFKTNVDQTTTAETGQIAGGGQSSDQPSVDGDGETMTPDDDTATDDQSTPKDDDQAEEPAATSGDDSSDEALPQTGPASDLMTAAAAALLAFAIVAYVRSRNTLTSVVD